MKEELSASIEVRKGEGENGEAEELVGVSAGDAKEGSGDGKAESKWQSLTACDSPKRKSPLAGYAVIPDQNSQASTKSSPSPKNTSNISNGTLSWQARCGLSSTKAPSQEGLNTMLSSFDFFSNEEYPDEDKTAISIAFGK